MESETRNGYQYLVARSDKWKKQLYVKGRGCLTARHVVGMMLSNQLTPEETAKAYSLPVEAVLEAWQYYQENNELVDAEVREERRRGGLE
jgi:uncharacterized protein (DUF433 family)